MSSINHPALQCENLHVTSLAWKGLLVPWLKNRQMFPVGTNTVPAVIASSESGQAVIWHVSPEINPAYCCVLEAPPNKILSNILMFAGLDPGIKQAMKLVPPASRLQVRILFCQICCLSMVKKLILVLSFFFVSII